MLKLFYRSPPDGSGDNIEVNMSLMKLSNKRLDSHLKSLVSSEREILKEILIHIAEADRRRLYLDFGYPSLFADQSNPQIIFIKVIPCM